MIVDRVSNWPLTDICPAHLHMDGIKIRRHFPQGPDGTCAHAIAEDLIANGSLPDLDAFMDKHEVTERDRVKMCSYIFAKQWKRLGKYFPSPMMEQELEYVDEGRDITARGHPDIMAVIEETKLHLADMKFGRLEPNARMQMAGYAYAVMVNNPQITSVVALVVWVPDDSFVTYAWSRDEVLEIGERHMDSVASWDHQTHTTGDHCVWCPGYHQCPAQKALLRQGVALLIESSDADVPAKKIPELYSRYLVAKKFLDEVQHVIRTRVTIEGPIDCGDGKELRMNEEQRVSIDALPAWEHLTGLLTADELAGCITIGKGKLEKAVATKAARGKGAAAKRELMATLTDLGAISTSPITKLVKAKKKEITDGEAE